MIIETIILASSLLCGLGLLGHGWKRFRKRQSLRGIFSAGLAVCFLFVSSLIATFLLDHNTYQRLTLERPIAQLTLHKLGEHYFQAVLKETDNKPVFLDLHGDQWQLDARLIKWNGTAAWVGLKPLFRLERISGRYQDINLEKNSPHSAYQLDQGLNPQLWNFLIEYQDFIPWFDAYYGSATYMPMTHGAKFTINISATGLIARAANKKAADSLRYWMAPI